MKYPTIYILSDLIKSIKPYIYDDFIQDDDTLPSIQLTIGYTTEDGSWSYQTGDNSYSGGAYFHRHWAVVYIYRRTNSRDLAKEIIRQLQELTTEY